MQKKIYLLSAIILCFFLKLDAQVGINLPNQTVVCGEIITLPVTVKDFTGMRGLQFSINWDTSKVVFESTGLNEISNSLPNSPVFDSPNADKGQLSFLWFNQNTITLSDGDTIMLFTLQVKETNFDSTIISFSDNPILIEGNNGGVIPVTLANGIIKLADAVNPTITCFADQFISAPIGNSSIAVINIPPTAADNCGIDSIFYQLSGATTVSGLGDVSGQQFNVGVTTVTYTVMDFKGNTAQCSFEVTITNGGAPADTVQINGGNLTVECGNTLNIPINVAGFDSITNVQLVLSWNASQFTFNAIDNFNLAGLNIGDFDISQTASGTIILNWTNATPQSKVNGVAIFVLQLSAATTLNNAPINLNNLSVERNGAVFPSKSRNGSITIQDTTAPTISCPSNKIMAVTIGQPSVVVNGLAPTAMDNCGTPTVTYQLTGATTGNGVSDASGTNFNIGTTTVIYTAVDGNNITASCSFTVMVTNESPTKFTLISQSAAADCDANDIAIDINVALFDSIAGTQFSVNWNPSILSYSFRDNIRFPTEAGFDTIDLNNGRIGYSWFNALTETLANGTTLFTLHFTPSGGGTSGVTFTGTPTPIEINHKKDGFFQIISMDSIDLLAGSVIISDNVRPNIVCRNDTTIQLAMGQSSVVVNGLDPLSISDNCGVDSVFYTLSGATIGSGLTTASGQTFNIGTTVITYTVKDNGSNQQQCSSTVNISVPNALLINVVNPPAQCGDSLFRIDITVDSFINVLGLQFSVEWDENVLVFDSVGNLALPEFTIAGNFTTTFQNDGKLAFAWFDNGLNGETLSDGAVLFSIFYRVIGGAGATSNIIIGDDPIPREGNVKTSMGRIIVPVIGNSGQVIVIDNESPVVINPLPDTIIYFVNSDSCRVEGVWTVPQFMDLCSGISPTQTNAPGDLFDIGQHTIKYTATDQAGNITIDSAILIIRDTIAPIITNCPANITTSLDANCLAIVTWTEPTAADNCSVVVILSSTHISGDTFMLGTTTVTYTAEDAYGNRSSCSFEVTVTGMPITFDNNFPANITINSAQGQCGANIGWTPPTASGGCANNGDTIRITSTSQPGDFFPVGPTAVIYTATDGGGQSIMDTFTITVIDNQELVVLCPTDIEIQADGTIKMDDGNFINTVRSDTCGSYIITFNDITAFDNCSPVTVTQTLGPVSGDVFGFGTTMMEFVMADTSGNSRTCIFQIKINETQALMAFTPTSPLCAGMDIQLMVDSLIGGSFQWTGPSGFLANIQNPIIPNAMTQNSGDYIVKVISANGCSIKDSVSVGIRSSPEIEAIGNDVGCTTDEDTIRLFATVVNGIPIQTYSWTGPGGYMSGFQNPVIPNATAANAGIYIVTGISGNGCFDIDTVVVSVIGMVTPTLISSAAGDTVCLGESFTLTGTAYTGIVTYTWLASPGAGLPLNSDTNILVLNPTAPGTYIYSFLANLDGNCTSDTARIEIFVADAPSITLSSNAPLVCVNSSDSINLSATGGTGMESYSWTGPNGYSSREQNPSISPSNAAAGNYILNTTFAIGCTSTDSINVAVTAQGAPPVVTLSSSSTFVCEGDTLALTAENNLNATYAWIGPNDFTSNQRVVLFQNVANQNSGAYQVTYTIDGCTSVPRTVGPLSVLSEPNAQDDAPMAIINTLLDFNVITNDIVVAGAPFTINIISPVNSGTLVNNSDGTFQYTPSDNFVGIDQFAYEICYMDCPNLCDMATVSIRTEFPSDPCFVPTVITPNGDGMNDVLFISCVSSPPKQGSELIVFNEWGSEVFREFTYQNNWQGTYKGKDLPDGTYYYIYKKDSNDPNPEKGYFSLFR